VDLPIKIVIFHSYVKLPEGKLVDTEANGGFMVDKCTKIVGIINNSRITVGPSNKSNGLKEPDTITVLLYL